MIDELTVFENVELLAKDSMYIFIESTIDIQTLVSNQTQFLYTDAIEFDSGGNLQEVELVTLVKDAVFIYPQRFVDNQTGETIVETLTFDVDGDGNDDETTIQGRFLEDNELIFTNEKPYVIYGYAAVNDSKTLTIEAGARLHFHANSGLLVANGGSLKVNGLPSMDQELLEGEVTFEGDRLEPQFSNTPGQWGTIWLRAGSKENEINYAQIKNGSIGILVDSITSSTSPTLTLKNTEIFNHSNFGVLARETSILGENIVIGNAGEASLACVIGGSYNFTHSTFANYWNNGIRSLPAVLVNNFYTYTNASGQEVIETRDLIAANFTNCIIDGNNNIEFLPDRADGSLFNFKVANSLIKFTDINNSLAGVSEVDFDNTSLYENILLNGVSHFRNVSSNDFIIGQDSQAINFGNSTGAGLVPLDILGVTRTISPDAGAYQHIDF